MTTACVDLVIFPREPMTGNDHEANINGLVRACDVHDVPCVTNPAGARGMLAHLVAVQRMASRDAAFEVIDAAARNLAPENVW